MLVCKGGYFFMYMINKVFLITAFIIFISVLSTAIVTASTAGGVYNFSSDNQTLQSYYMVNSTKLTGGWPFLENDQYNTLGVDVIGADYNPIGWELSIEATDLSSSRIKGSPDKTYAIKSQSISDIGDGGDFTTTTSGSNSFEWSWPRGGTSSQDMMVHPQNILLTATVNATAENMPFPLNSTALNESMNGGTGAKISSAPDGRLTSWYWSYSFWPWGSISDCAASIEWLKILDFGSRSQFDVVGDTQWGLFDQSESMIHIKVTLPPDPKGMNTSELNAYHITAWTLNNSNVGYSINDLNIEMS